MSENAKPAHAVLFKTHFWDDFIARRFAALKQRCPGADLFVCVDETHGPVGDIPPDKVFRSRDSDMYALGFPRQPDTRYSLNQYNVDYPLLAFHEAHAEYAFYIMVEYDVAVHHDLDAMAAEALRCGIDLIGFPNRGAIEDWHWTRTLEGLWPRDEIQRRLLCISGFSERAVAYLMAKRRECAARFLRGEFPFWPFCEGFVPTALHEAGFTLESLARFGSVDCYRWGPPYHESELPAMMDQAFVHPVLTGHRYATSVLRIPKLAEIYLADPESRPRLELAPTKTVFPASRSKLAANRGLQTWLRRRLDLEPPEVVLPALAAALVRDGSSEALAALHQALAERGRDDLSVGSETNCSASRH